MAVQVKLVTDSSPKRLRERLLDEFRKAAQQPGSALWIGPSAESIQEVRAHLASSAGALLSPLLFDWEGLARHILRKLDPALKPLAPIRQKLLLQETIGELKRQKRLEYFERIADSRGFLDSLAGLIDELGQAEIARNQFVAATSRERGNDNRSRKRRDAAALIKQHHSLLENEKAYDASDAVHLAAERLQTSPFPKVEQLFVDGGQELSRPQLSLLQRFAPQLKQMWIGLPDENGEERKELFRVSRKTQQAVRDAFTESKVLTGQDEEVAPAGLRHLRKTIFSGHSPAQTDDASGLSIIEAPGALGEARLIARRIRQLLSEGVRPERIVVTARRLTGSRGLLAEVFDEYRVPFDIEGDEPLSRDPHVKSLLKAARLCEDEWAFEGVTAFLRNTLVCPAWKDLPIEAELPRQAEALLRMIGAPRGRDAVLRAVNMWADNPPEALEDEDAEEPLRVKKTRLAKEVRPFLQRFFKCWDCFRHNDTAEQYAKAMRSFAEEFSLVSVECTPLAPREESSSRGARGVHSNESALAHFFRELDAWSRSAKRGTLSRAAFFRMLNTIASAPQPTARSAAGRVRVRSAEAATVLEADYLFILGLGENSFPDLSPPDSLLDDADRHQLSENDLVLSNREERLPREMLLFYRLISLPDKELILSFPAVDAKGQPLLPSSFLRSGRDCFSENAIQPETQSMLIAGYFERAPMSESELRVQFAAAAKDRLKENSAWKHPQLPERLTDNLFDAARMAQDRFHATDFGVYDGMLSQPRIVQKLHEKFGPNKTFSPTALEAYVACPFKFFLDSVLRLDELDEPVEEVEASRRGSAFHRALARFHNKLRKDTELRPNDLDEGVSQQLQEELDVAIDEYMRRAPSDAASILWDLEGKRLQRFAARYRDHWRGFAQPWHEKKALPLPLHLEADFGLPRYSPTGERLDPENPALIIQIGGVEVRIGGRIDRVDVAEMDEGLGFWIIDYKTGRASNYTGSDLASFKKLQLSLYALAVERVFLKGQHARPLGLAYWLVTDTGPKTAMPDGRNKFDWFLKAENWQRFRQQLEEWVAKLVGQIREGRFPLSPRSEDCTATCAFGQICRITQSRDTGKVFDLALPGKGDDVEVESES